jgi:hypothetical protein
MRLGGALGSLGSACRFRRGNAVAVGPIVEGTKGRFEGALLIAMVVFVQIAWGGALIYFAVRYL